MGNIAAETDTTTTPAVFRARPFLVRSIMLGVLIAFFSGPFRAVVISLARAFAPDLLTSPDLGPQLSIDVTAVDFALALGVLLILAPVLESLAFPLVYWLTRWLPAQRPLFILVIGVLAYIAHGMTIVNTAQAAGFMLMAAWYAHLREHYPSPRLLSPVKIPYYGIVLVHFAWNTTAVLWGMIVARLLGLPPY